MVIKIRAEETFIKIINLLRESDSFSEIMEIFIILLCMVFVIWNL
jgi:hypothetical protein